MRFTVGELSLSLTAIGLLVAFSAAAALAAESQRVGRTEVPAGAAIAEHDQIELQGVVAKDPVWRVLERLTQEERENSEIQLILEKDAAEEAVEMARRIENTWNKGKFEEALEFFAQLENLTNINEMAIGNSWRTPVPTVQGSLWDTDVRIGNRDSVFITALDIHRASGKLFAVLLLQGDGATNWWTVNHSTNNGASWRETYDWWANYDINSLSTSVVASHCYVGFSRGSAQDQAFLYRFKATSGGQENFAGGSEYLTVFITPSPDSIKEVAVVSNQDLYDSRLHYISITTEGNLRFFWAYEPDFEDWTELLTNVANADRGLDATCNEGFADYFLWSSYITASNNLRVDAIGASTEEWDSLLTYAIGPSTDYTSIAAYHDTVTCFFEYGGSVFHCRYLRSYDAGSNWSWGVVDDTTTMSEAPDVTARKGGGVGVVYRFCTSPREGRYTWCDDAGSWQTPVAYTDHQPYWNKPSIEYLGGGIFGVVYLSWTSPHTRAAYFDRHVQTSVDEWHVGLPSPFELLQNYPNPFNATTVIEYQLPVHGYVKLEICNILGQRVITLVDERQQAGYRSIIWNASDVSSGLYFYKLTAGDFSETRRMMLVK